MTSKGALAPLKDEEEERDQFNRAGILETNVGRVRRKGNEANRRMRRRTFEVDISKLESEGDFPCPKCGVIISPDDESEETYTILDTKGDEDSIEEVVIQCKKCGSVIQLKGFVELEEIELESTVKISEPQTGSQPGFRTIHTISLEDKEVGRVVVEYLQKEDVKAFSKIHRDLKAGDAFQARVFIDSSGTTIDQLGNEGLAEIVKALKRRAKSLRERDIFIVTVEGSRERLIGRAEDLIQELTD